nr:hypothetical protein [Tanacetum cinerariifolium]
MSPGNISADVARGHDGDGRGDDRPPPYHGVALALPSWRQMPPERKAGVVAKIEHLQKIYNGKKAALKERYWVPEEDGSYDLERIRHGRPHHISKADWDAQLAFWNDPKTLARATQNKQNRAKSKVVCQQGSRSIVALRDMRNNFEVLKLLENSVDVLKILENKLKSMKILENKLKSLKLQENQSVDGLVPLSIKKFTSEGVFERLLKSKDNNFDN